MKKVLKTTVCLVLILSMFVGCSVVNVASVGEVNGEKILFSKYKYAMTLVQMFFGAADSENTLGALCQYDQYLQSYMYEDISALVTEAGEADPGENLWDKALGDTTVGDKARALAFDKLAEIEIAIGLAKEREITLSDEEKSNVTQYLNNIIDNVFGSKGKLTEALKSVNMTEKDLKDLWQDIALANKVKTSLSEDATEEDINTFYQDNYIRVKHILVKVGDDIADMDAAKAKIDEIYEKLNAGEDFDALMKEYSNDVDGEGNVNNADAGYLFTADTTGYVDGFVEAGANLAVGEYTAEPVKVESSYSGYHILKRYELEETGATDYADAIKSEIANKAYNELIAGAKESANIVKNEGRVKGYKLIELKAADEEAAVETVE